MTRAILPIGFALFCLMIGNAALSAVTAALEVEAVEICQRDGGSIETCGRLPGQ